MEGPAKKPRVIQPVWPVIVPGLGLFWSLPTPLKKLIFFEYLVPPSKVMLAMTLMQKMPGLRHALRMLRMVGFDSISEYRIEDFHAVDLELDWWSWCMVQSEYVFHGLREFGVEELDLHLTAPPFAFRTAAHEKSAGRVFTNDFLRAIRLFHWACVDTTQLFLLCLGAGGNGSSIIKTLEYLKREIELHGPDATFLRDYGAASLVIIRGAMRRSPEDVVRRTIQAVRQFHVHFGLQMIHAPHCVFEYRRLDLLTALRYDGAACIGKSCFGVTQSRFSCSPLDFCRALREKGALIDQTATLVSLMPLDVDTFIEASEFGFPLGGNPYDIAYACQFYEFEVGYMKNWKIGHHAYVQRKYRLRVNIDFFVRVFKRRKEEEYLQIFEWACAALPESKHSPGLTRDGVACSLFHALLKKNVKGPSPKIHIIAFLRSFLPMDNIDSHAIKAMLQGTEQSKNRALRDICDALGIKRKYARKKKKPENNE